MHEAGEKFETWALLEIMGHQQYAGLVTEQVVAGQAFIRIDIPANEEDGVVAFTKLFGPSSVYSISPIEETAARALARSLKKVPLTVWELPDEVRRAIASTQKALPQPVEGFDALDLETDDDNVGYEIPY